MKKTVSFLLILVLLLSCLPLDTLATETDSIITETASVEESIAAIQEETAPAETSEATITVDETIADEESAETVPDPAISEIEWQSIESPMNAYALAEMSENSDEGNQLMYSIKDNVLTITGKGALPDYTLDQKAPWYQSRKRIYTIVVGEGVSRIGDYAFYYCTEASEIEISNTVTSIGSNAFNRCTKMQNISIPQSVTVIGNEAFYCCTSLRSITIPDSVTSLGDGVFSSCQSLMDITLGCGISSLGKDVFSGCMGLPSIAIPEGVTSIGKDAFSMCYSMTEIAIPASVTSIGDRIFGYCKYLSDVYYAGTQEQWDNISVGDNNEVLRSASVHCGVGQIPAKPEQPVGGVDSSFLAPIDQITDEDAIPEGYTPIYNEVDLNNIKNNLSGKYILMRDIELKYTTSLNYKSSPFTGVLDGNGHTISGLTETEWYGPTMYWGLFESISCAEISNLKITGTFDVKIGSMGYTECEVYLGGLTGEAIGAIRITNCVNDITFNCKAEYNDYLQVYLGGLIGKYRGSSGVIKDCRNIAEIACVENTGGLVGYADCSGEFGIVNCRNDANITCTKEVSPDDISGLGGPFGGIVGYVGGKRASVYISSCMNTGNVVHYDGNFPPAGSCGGIVGNGGAAAISSCANTGKVSGLLYVGGIAGDLSDSAMVQDCLNTGAVRINNAQYYGGGIAGGGGRFYRCINTGMVTTPVVQGKAYNSGIVAKPGSSTLEEAEAAVVDCYWLDDGQTNTLYSRYSYDFGETKAIRTRGALSMRQMTEMESFQNFSFPDIWVMDEKLGHPRPTGMVIVTLENAYQAAYIEKMKISLENYEKIISASGYGSLAATLGNAYEKANLDKVNGAWDVMQIAEGWANYSSTELSDYDLLLADLLVGVIGRDTRDKHITSNVLNNISELITEAGAGLSATEILATEQYLKDMAAVPTVFGSAASKLVSGVRSTALKNVPYKKLGDCMNILGGLVSIADAAAAGCETVQDAFDFYVLCNAYADMVTTYGDVIHSAASRVLTLDSIEEDEAGELFRCTDEFVALMHQNLNKDVESLCKATENSVANLMVTGGCTIVEGVLNITELNPVLSVLNYIFSGVKLGVTIGMPIADSLTQMDDLAYYGRMMQMCGTFSKGLFVEVQDRMAAFKEDPTYEKAQAMELASDLYARLQILACDYGIGYYTALISSNLSEWLHLNQGKDVEAMAMLQSYQNALQEAIDSGKPVYIGQDGSVYGFIANCPVTIVITDTEGKEIARLKTGEITTDEDYAGNYLLLGENGEHKAGMYDPSKHTVTLIGEAEGTMDLIAYCVKDGTLGRLDSYLDVSIDNGYTAKLEVDENGQFHLIQESEETILWGDASGDGRVNAMDATRILRYAAKLIKEDKIDLIAADVNSDGRVNAMDATRILRYAAKLIPELKVQK